MVCVRLAAAESSAAELQNCRRKSLHEEEELKAEQEGRQFIALTTAETAAAGKRCLI